MLRIKLTALLAVGPAAAGVTTTGFTSFVQETGPVYAPGIFIPGRT